jgi:hypothetical protein
MVVTDAPLFDHGEIADSPRPIPSATNVTDKAAATNAPALTAAHDTADTRASLGNAATPDDCFIVE